LIIEAFRFIISARFALYVVPYGVFTRSSKRPAKLFKILVLMLDVCWTVAGSCKHPIKSICLFLLCHKTVRTLWLHVVCYHPLLLLR